MQSLSLLTTVVENREPRGSVSYSRNVAIPPEISSTMLNNVVLSGKTYHQNSNISRTLESSKIVDHSDVVGASPVGAAPTTSSFST